MSATVVRRSPATWVALALAVVALITPVASGRFRGSHVEVTQVVSRSQVRPGDQVVIAVIFDHEDGWHIHTNDPKPPKEWGDFPAIETVVTQPRDENGQVIPQAHLTFGPVQWPEASEVTLDLTGGNNLLPYAVFEGRAIAYVPVIVSTSAPVGPLEVHLKIGYQACDDRVCAMPEDVAATLMLDVVAPGAAAPAAPPDPAVFGGFDPGVFSDMLAGKVAAEDVEFDLFGVKLFKLEGANPAFLVLLLLAAALGGLILNLTPCVIPVIPIKIMSLSSAAGNPARCLFLGLVTSAGIVSFWLVIGSCIAFIASFKQVNQLFQLPWFTIGVGVFVALMALSMLGLYTIHVPQWVYRFLPAANPRSKDGSAGGSTTGTFLSGVFTAILSTPCTAPFMATASAWAARQPPALSLATFGAIGVGMALPYAVLSAFPKWISKVPRSGPASNVVKEVMGVLMVGVAIFFLGTGIDPLVRLPIDPAIRWFWWLVTACIVGAMGLLVFKTYVITTSGGKRAFWTVVGLAISGGGVLMGVHFTDRGPIPWVAYTPERFEEARATNKVVVLDFTAEWCLNCKALEHGVLHRAEVVTALTSAGVVPMRVDLSGKNAAGSEKLKSLNWVGIPLLAISGPGQVEPLKFDTYTSQTVLEAIQKARGASGGVAGVTDGTVGAGGAESGLQSSGR